MQLMAIAPNGNPLSGSGMPSRRPRAALCFSNRRLHATHCDVDCCGRGPVWNGHRCGSDAARAGISAQCGLRGGLRGRRVLERVPIVLRLGISRLLERGSAGRLPQTDRPLRSLLPDQLPFRRRAVRAHRIEGQSIKALLVASAILALGTSARLSGRALAREGRRRSIRRPASPRSTSATRHSPACRMIGKRRHWQKDCPAFLRTDEEPVIASVTQNGRCLGTSPNRAAHADRAQGGGRALASYALDQFVSKLVSYMLGQIDRH